MLGILRDGGPMAWVLLLASVAAAVVFFERLLYLHRAQIKTGDFLRGIFTILRRQNRVEAIAICDETPGPVARVIRAAILHMDGSPAEVRHAIRESALAEIPRIERHVGVLGVIAQTAPLLGLLGTVLGMMQMFLTLQQKAPLIHAGDLGAGLWTALIATAAGLSVAIASHVGYSFLVGRVESLALDMEHAALEMIAFIRNAGSENTNLAVHEHAKPTGV